MSISKSSFPTLVQPSPQLFTELTLNQSTQTADSVPALRRHRLPKVRRQIRATLLHEAGHCFGLSEDELRGM